MKNGLPAKLLIVVGLILFVAVFFVFNPWIVPSFLPNEAEYKKDRAHLLATMKTRLPETALSQVKYPLKSYMIPGVGGNCSLESASGLANYLEPDIDFDTFVIYGNPALFMANRNKDERYGWGGRDAFISLGYTIYRGSTQSTNPPQNTLVGIDPQNLIYFKTQKEEFEFIKKLLSVGIIPTVDVKSEVLGFTSRKGGGDFAAVSGYNNEGVWLNIPLEPAELFEKGVLKQGMDFMTPPIRYEAKFYPFDLFFKAWAGDQEFYWREKTGQRLDENKIYQQNKKDAQEAPANIQKTVEFLGKNGDVRLITVVDHIPASMALYRYFTKKGNAQLAALYLEAAKIYHRQNEALGPQPNHNDRQYMIDTLNQVKPLYEEAARLWN